MDDILEETEIVRIILRVLGQPKPPFAPIGDDVAMMSYGNKSLVMKTDMFVGSTDLPPGMNLFHAARKTVVMCVSDFAAKGIRPTAAMISLGLKRPIHKNDIVQLAKGFRAAAKEFGLSIIGGDTNESNDLVIDCAMFGFGRRPILRSGAKPGDIVIVTGPFGYTSLGLHILLGNPKTVTNSKLTAFERECKNLVLLPRPQLALGLALTKAKLLNASMDSSDGLALSLWELAERSNVEINIVRPPETEETRSYAEKYGLGLEEVVFHGGEEYEIVATLPPENWERARKIAQRLDSNLIPIGKVVKGSPTVRRITHDRSWTLEKRGWTHFSRHSADC